MWILGFHLTGFNKFYENQHSLEVSLFETLVFWSWNFLLFRAKNFVSFLCLRSFSSPSKLWTFFDLKIVCDFKTRPGIDTLSEFGRRLLVFGVVFERKLSCLSFFVNYSTLGIFQLASEITLKLLNFNQDAYILNLSSRWKDSELGKTFRASPLMYIIEHHVPQASSCISFHLKHRTFCGTTIFCITFHV